jgi:hypothetical protein
MLLYLYSRAEGAGVRRLGLEGASVLRRLTVRMPHPLLRALSAPLAALLYAAFVVPGRLGASRGLRRLAGLPLSTYRGMPLRSLWLDTFDRLSAPIEHRYSWNDVAPWFEESHLVVEHVREESGLFVVARKRQRPRESRRFDPVAPPIDR